MPPSALTESASSITFSVIGELIARVILKRAVEAGKTLGRPLSPAIEKRIGINYGPAIQFGANRLLAARQRFASTSQGLKASGWIDYAAVVSYLRQRPRRKDRPTYRSATGTDERVFPLSHLLKAT